MSEHATRPSVAHAFAGGVAKLVNAAERAAAVKRVREAPHPVLAFADAVAASPEMVAVLADPLVLAVVREGRVLRELSLLLRLGVHAAPAHAVEAVRAAVASREMVEALVDPAVTLMLRDPKNLRELAQLLRMAANPPSEPDSPAVN